MPEALPRILVLANLPSHVLGGAENQVARLVGAWRALGADVEVAGHRIPDGVQVIGGHRVRTHHLRTWPRFGRIGRGLGYAFSLLGLLVVRRADFDVAYCRGLGDGVLGVALWRFFGICRWKIVAVPINARGTGDAYFLRSLPLARVWLRLLDRKVDCFNLINAETAADLDALGLRRARRTAIPNGIPILPPIVRREVAEVRRLVWTGRFEPQKGLDLLLPALAARRRAGARFRLTLWGDGAMRESLRRQVDALGLGEDVVFAGVCPAEGVRDALRDADAFVLPSRYEGMSNSALEAMEAGLPVLCTRCGGIDKEIENGAGWTCAPDDGGSLDSALEEMFSSPASDWLARGRRARELVEAHYAIDGVAVRNLAMIASVVNETGSA